MKASTILKLVLAVIMIPLCLGLFVRFLYKDVQEVCVPVHVNLDTSKYRILHVDTLDVIVDFPVKKIYYVERN